MILIINICKDRLHELEFVKPIEDILKKNNIPSITKHYKEIKEYDSISAKKIIICGTSLKDTKYLENAEDFGWLKNFNKPILGICGGMQLLALIHNGKLHKNCKIGSNKIEFNKPFLNIKEERNVYSLHNLTAISDEFITFDNSTTPQAIKHKHKEIYGTLFHPEVRNKDLILNFCKDLYT